MVRTTRRAKRIKKLRDLWQKRMQNRLYREVLEEDDDYEDEMDELVGNALDLAESTRYHAGRGKYRKSDNAAFKRDLQSLENDPEVLPWLNNDEFRQKYRVSRESFVELVDLIKDDPIFAKKHGRKQVPASYQLLVLLKFLGTEGTGSSSPDLRNVFGIGRGTTQKYRDRALKAIRRLKSKVVTWPDDDECKIIAERIFKEYDFPNCVGIIDGTLFPLAFEPETEDAPDYKGRKYQYSLTCLIVCDDQCLIQYYLAGWPGCAHDERVFRNSKLYREAQRHFSLLQYILGDSAFENLWFIVSSYRRPRGATLPREEEVFNDAMKKLRVISEHTIGILKGRFPYLRQIRTIIKDDRKSMKRILAYIEGAIILHNLLVQRDDEIPDDWIDEDDRSDMSDEDRACEDLMLPIPEGAPNDERRRQLTAYHNERHVIH